MIIWKNRDVIRFAPIRGSFIFISFGLFSPFIYYRRHAPIHPRLGTMAPPTITSIERPYQIWGREYTGSPLGLL